MAGWKVGKVKVGLLLLKHANGAGNWNSKNLWIFHYSWFKYKNSQFTMHNKTNLVSKDQTINQQYAMSDTQWSYM